MAQHRNGDVAQIPHVDASAGQSADQRPFEHARTAVRIAIDRHIAAFGQSGAQRGAQFGGKFGGQVDIDHAGDAEAAEECTSPLVAPEW